MTKFSSLLSLLLIFKITLSAQETKKTEYVKAIEDNSFFIEEAYNQEDHVVQHISNATYSLTSSHDFIYSFTQEWPLFSSKHQFSYSLGFSDINFGNDKGLTDMMLNYRYQLAGHDDFITIAPRFSLILPTGDSKRGLGYGVVGYQFALPMSKRLTNSLAVHVNFNYTILPDVKTTDLNNIRHKNTLSNYNFGASAIWLLFSNTNLMLEVLYVISQQVSENNTKSFNSLAIISPGIRHAIEVKELEIVPGFALPLTIQNGNAGLGLFFYLSFEHPF